MKERRHKVIRKALIILLIGALYGAFCIITGKGIPCPFYKLTGYKCPGCGISRMFLSLIRLDFKSAFQFNGAVLCLLPLMVFIACRKIRLYIKTGISKDKLSDIMMWFMTGILILFGIFRNII